jgi:hypothetical protein
VSLVGFLFPSFEYHLDETDPDIVLLRRQDDAFVAAFSARGVTRQGIVEAAREDYRKLMQVHWPGNCSEKARNIAALDLNDSGLCYRRSESVPLKRGDIGVRRIVLLILGPLLGVIQDMYLDDTHKR